MNKKVGVLLVHGMGAITDDFAHDTIQELRERISGRGLNREDIAWQSVYWAPTLSAQESRLWVDLSAEHDLNWAKLRKKAKWLNLFDADDVLGWPLKQLSLSYSDAVSEDIEVSVGNILTSWNPANHAAYWTDDTVIKPVAYLISSLLESCQS